MKHILFINGPIGSGKDTLADQLCERYGYEKLEFKEYLFKTMYRFFNISDQEDFLNKYYTRETKELPCDLLQLNGVKLSPRSALIHISENVIKPTFGSDIFGKVLLERINNTDKNIVFSDCGFLEEILTVSNNVDRNCYLMHLYRDGTSFEGDSRNYVDVPETKNLKFIGSFKNIEYSESLSAIIDLSIIVNLSIEGINK